MTEFLLIILTLIWLGGAFFRIYKQARFFQIEEYKPNRYLRWWLSSRDRALPSRTLIATVVGLGLAFLMGEAPDSVLPVVIALIATLVAVWPPDEGEIKKTFRPTQRAIRMLAAAFSVGALNSVVLVLILLLPHIDSVEFQVAAVMITGLLLYLAVPLVLVLGSLLMLPVEGIIRNRFIRFARNTMQTIDPKVIGITGSYGKTTTKNFVTDILNSRYKVYATPKSYNTMMGVCLAINNDMANDYSTEYFVVEMGAYIQGEIARIADLTPPHISIVTEVGPQHLERFGSLENIATAKYEIIKALPPDGLGVFNWDNSYVREMYERGYPANRLAVSKTVSSDDTPENGPRFVASVIEETLDGLSFLVTDTQTGMSEQFTTPVVGEHNVTNILLATAVAIHEGMTLRDVAFRVRTLRPAESRLVSHTTPEGITIINDAYSANPAGVVSALRVLGLHDSGKRLLITPGMIELGDLHEPENHKLGQIAAEYATDVILVGTEQTRPIRQGLEAASFPRHKLQVVDELREAMTWYQTNLQAGDTVLFLNDLPDTY